MSTILIAEDNQANRELMREILEAHGFSILEAVDGEQAIAQLRFNPDLALLDIRMPKKNGFEVLHVIRNHQHLARLPVFAVTAFAMDGDREHAVAAGFDAYITKPVAKSELIAAIRAALKDSRKRSADRSS